MLRKPLFETFAPGRCENKGAGRIASSMKRGAAGKVRRAVNAVVAILLAFIMVLSPLAPATPAIAAGLGDLFGLLSPRSENVLAAQGKKDLRIAVVSDTHYYPLNYVTGCEDYRTYVGGDPKMLEESGSIIDAAFDMVKADRPDLLLISGDLTKDGEVQGLTDIAAKLAEVEKAGTQVYVINGNHDIYNSDACTFADGKKEQVESASPAKFREIFAAHGYDGAEGQTYYKDSEQAKEAKKEYNPGLFNTDDDIPGCLSYTVDLGNYMILAIDSGQYLPSAGTGLDTKEHITAGRIDKHVLAWAEEQVKAASAEGKTVVGLMHHGLIPHFKGEDNVLSEYVVDNWRHAAATLADAGMRYIFTGHMHANDVAEFTTPKGNHITDLETGSLSAYGTPVRTVSLNKGERLGEDDKRTSETFTVTSKSVEEVTLKFADGSSQQVSSLTDYASEKLYGEKMFNNLAGGMLRPILQEIGSTGLRAWLQQNLPDLDIHQMAIGAIAGGLAGGIDMDLGTIGRVHVDYRNNAINLTPSGIAGIVGAASVSDQQVISIIDDLLDQVEAKYIDNPEYLLGEVDKIVTRVSEYGVASLDDGQKSLYDLVFVLLTGHYAGHEGAPAWTEAALAGIRSGVLVQNLITALVDDVTAESGLVDTLIGSLSINVGLAFSGTWKTVINGATDNGNLKSVLGLAGLDNAGIKGLVNGLIGEYMSPSFLTGMGGIVGDICDSMLHDTDGGDHTAIDGTAPVNDDKLNDAQSPFTTTFDGSLKPQQPSAENGLLPTQVTMTLGKNAQTDRSVRWFTGTQVATGAVQVSATKDFENAKTYRATSDLVVKPRTQLNLGLVTSYGTQPAMKHSAEIAGLRENASYYYRVGSEDLDIWSEPIRFATGAAGDDEDTFTFLNLNDSQGMVKADYATYLNTLGKANEMFPGASFVLHAGDFVDDGANEDYWTWALGDPANIAQGLAMMPAAGNHEARSNVPGITDANPIASHFNLSGVDMPEQDQASGVYYSFTYKNATVVVLNSNDLEGNALSQKQYAWANEVLSGADTTWKIVLLHKSAYSNGPHHDDADVLAIRRQLDQLAADNKVDLVLSGHDHVYNRTVPLSRGSEQEVESKTESYQGRNYEVQQAPSGTTFVIAGTAGVKNYEQSVAPEAHSAVSLDLDVPVFAGFKIDGDRLYYDAYKVEGGASVRVDNFAISKDVAEQQAWEKVVDLIAALPEQSRVALSDEDAIVAAREAYNQLSEEDRALVSNVDRLTAAEKTLAALKDVAGKETRAVTSYKDFKAAVADPAVGSIIVRGTVEGIEPFIGAWDHDIYVEHNVTLKGAGRLTYVQLHVKDGATLVLEDQVAIDDSRKFGSSYGALNPVEVHEGGTLITRGSVSLRTEYGTGSEGYCVKLSGPRATAILGSKGSVWAATGAVYSPAENTSIVVEDGTYSVKNNDHFVIDTRGSLTIAGGTVGNAWVGPNGSFRMTGGTLEHQGGDENAKPSLALECADSYLTAGAIVPFNGAAVELRGSSKLHVLAKKAGDVKIGSAAPYMGAISTSNYRDVVVGYTEVNGWSDVDGICRAEGAGNTSSVDRIAELAKTAGKVGTTHENGYMKAALFNGTNPVFGRYILHGEGKNGNAMGLTGSGSAVVYGPVRVIENNPVTAVEIAGEKVRVADLSTRESADVQLTASVKPENAFDNAITWETSNKGASKVAPYGLVTMTKPGATTVTAKVASNNDLTDSAIVLGVKPAIEGPDAIERGDEPNAAFKAEDGMGKLGEQYQGLTKFTWSTSNEEIAAIDPETGELTEVKLAGKVDIIATLQVKSAGKDSGDWAQTGIAARKTVVIKGEPEAPSVDAVNALLDVKVSDTMKVGEGAAHEAKTFESLIENTEGANDSYEIGAVYDAKVKTAGLSAIAEFFGMAEPAHAWRADVTVKASPYVAAFDKDAKLDEGVHKLVKDQADSVKIVFEWNDETGAWKLAGGSESPIEFKVTCAKTVTFDANGGKLADEAQKTRSVRFGEKLGEMPEATREDHEFLGWFDAAEHGTEVNAETAVDFTEAKTYYAQWRQLDHVTITFDPNGGAFTEGDAPKRVHVAKDGRVTEKVEVPTFEGRTFLGWTYAKGDRKGLVDLNDKTFGDDTVLYALWETEVTPVTSTVTFNPNGGKLPEGAPESQQIAFGGTIAVLPEPTRIGYEFLGWFDADRKFEAGTTGVTGPIELTARWTPIMVSVSFDAQGGTLAADGAAARQVAYGSVLGELPEVGRENFEFLGWFDAETGGNRVTANTVVDFADAKTYYAQWEAKPAPDMSIAVTFNAGEGHFGEDETAHTVQRAFTKPATLHTSDVPAVFRDGYTLEGWYASKGFEEGTRVVFADEFGDQSAGGANVTVLNGDVELHARWLLNSWEMVDAPTAERPSSGSFDGRPHSVDLVFDERFPESERTKVTVEYRASASVRAFSDAGGWTAEAPTAAGVYDIRLGYAGTDEYAGFEIVRLRALEIEKAVLAGEPKPESTEVKRGTKLADIKLGGTAAMADGQPVKGAWSWVDAQGAVEEEGEFAAVFVPEDLDDIEPLYVKVTLTVKADSKPPVDPGNPNPPVDPGQGGSEPDNGPGSPAGSNRPQGDVAAGQAGDRLVQTGDAFSPVTVIVIVGAGAALVGAGICLSRRNKSGDDLR